MKILEWVTELHGVDVTLNGRDVMHGGTLVFEEEIFFKRLHPNQQWALLCEARKLLNRMEDSYERSQVARGEVTQSDYEALRRRRAMGKPSIKKNPFGGSHA